MLVYKANLFFFGGGNNPPPGFGGKSGRKCFLCHCNSNGLTLQICYAKHWGCYWLIKLTLIDSICIHLHMPPRCFFCALSFYFFFSREYVLVTPGTTLERFSLLTGSGNILNWCLPSLVLRKKWPDCTACITWLVNDACSILPKLLGPRGGEFLPAATALCKLLCATALPQAATSPIFWL